MTTRPLMIIFARILTRILALAAVLAGLALPSAVLAEPSPDQVLAKANAVVAPEAYTATVQMVAARGDGTTRTYVFRTMKQGSDKLRLSFDEPRTLSGHELLRLGDDLWRYVPSLKRSMRIASRDDFEAGDFRNADVLRVDLVHDYRVTAMKDGGDNWILDLAAATKQAGYDRIVYTVRKSDAMPVLQEFYAASGKKLRSATFSAPVSFGKHVRPSRVKMVNELTRGQSTDMTVQSFELVDSIPPRTFQRESLGR